jgi:hypothetical protein
MAHNPTTRGWVVGHSFGEHEVVLRSGAVQNALFHSAAVSAMNSNR